MLPERFLYVHFSSRERVFFHKISGSAFWPQKNSFFFIPDSSVSKSWPFMEGVGCVHIFTFFFLCFQRFPTFGTHFLKCMWQS